MIGKQVVESVSVSLSDVSWWCWHRGYQQFPFGFGWGAGKGSDLWSSVDNGGDLRVIVVVLKVQK